MLSVIVAVWGWLLCSQVARSLVLMSRYVSAIDVYDQILSKGARDWHVLHNRSICLSHIGRAEEAKVCLREVNSTFNFAERRRGGRERERERDVSRPPRPPRDSRRGRDPVVCSLFGR